MPSTRSAFAILLFCLLPICTQVVTAQNGKLTVLEKEYDKRRRKVLIDATTRHLRLGEWARKMGLNEQAMVQFLKAEEISEGHHQGAAMMVGVMRRYGDAFWRRHRKQVPQRSLKKYHKKAQDLVKRDRKDHFKLAKHAHNKKLKGRAQKGYEVLIRTASGTSEFDDKGNLVITGGVVPAEYVRGYKKSSVEIDGRLRARDAFLQVMTEIKTFSEVSSEELRVRSVVGQKSAARMHKMLTQLLPRLEAAVGGRPMRRLEVFVFAKRENFDLYLERAGYGASAADGLTDPMRMVALVCAEKRAPAVTQAVALHELVHLYQYAVGRAVFPSWYAEGFAETYGGQGTFSWKDDKLETGGMMSKFRLDALRKAELIPIEKLVVTDAMSLLRQDPDKAVLFYAQSWAFLRYLRTGAGKEVGEKLRLWEVQCRGAAMGAVRGARGRQGPAVNSFDSLFGDEIEDLETGFKAWLRLQ